MAENFQSNFSWQYFQDCLSSYQSQGESDKILPNRILFFESVGRIPYVRASVTAQMKQSRLFLV